jgi:putative ABC transport system ATP-binding protein
MANNAPLIEVQGVSKLYGSGENQTAALRDVSLTIEKGEFVAIMGPSGSGKSTLMHIIGCLDKPTSGSYIFKKEHVSQLSENRLAKIRNQEIGFVFQSFNLLPRTSALKNVELPLIYANVDKSQRQKRVTERLIQVGLGNKLASHPNQLSGGQQQRVAIARALINNPSLLLADEPTGNLDSKSSDEIMGMIRNLNSKGHSIIIITHERDVARNASRIITMRDGKILSDKKSSKMVTKRK